MDTDNTNISGKVVITGASSGLGEATSRYPADRGAPIAWLRRSRRSQIQRHRSARTETSRRRSLLTDSRRGRMRTHIASHRAKCV
jgi:NAD(P)-dependent dehydrogenase (short-subunit alcohol dehydrogenase family)